MERKRLMELAGIQLDEAGVIQSEKRRLATTTYKRMSALLDELQDAAESLEGGRLGRDMRKLGYRNEPQMLADKLNKAIKEFEDFMPGIEMASNGEE